MVDRCSDFEGSLLSAIGQPWLYKGKLSCERVRNLLANSKVNTETAAGGNWLLQIFRTRSYLNFEIFGKAIYDHFPNFENNSVRR